MLNVAALGALLHAVPLPAALAADDPALAKLKGPRFGTPGGDFVLTRE